MEITLGSSAIVSALFLVFLSLVVVFVYFGFTFNHHWGFYGFNDRFKKISQWIYFSVTSIVLVLILLFILMYIS